MITTTSQSPLPTQRSARVAANECLTTYPPQWMPAMLRATGLYGRNTAYGVALNFEYPLIPNSQLAKEGQAQ